MSRYIVAVPKDPRFDKYEYVCGGDGRLARFTDCVFDAFWYETRTAAEIAKNMLTRDYHAIVLSLENIIQQLDRENGYQPFYIIRDQSDNTMVGTVMSPIHVALFTDNLKDAKMYKTAAEAMDAIAEINDCKYNPYDLVVEMHHFDEFYIMSTKEMYAMFGPTYHLPEVKKLIFSNEVTIVLWKDGTKTIVRCQEGETFDPEKGLAIAFMKKAFGNKGNYYDKVRNLLNNATYQCDEIKTDQKDRKGCTDDAPLAKKTNGGTYKCPHCSRFVPSKRIEGKKGPFTCDKCGKKFNINWEGELDYEY